MATPKTFSILSFLQYHPTDSETDKYQRLLRYVVVDGLLVNYELVRKGYAESNKYVPDVACDLTLSDAETYARTNK